MPDGHPSSELQGVFNRPFTEQVAFFRRKLGKLVPTQRWDDLEREAHDDAFMVAGAAKADLLTDLAAAVDKAIAEGRGIEEFRRDFRSIVAKNGWTGWTGEGSVKGEAWRVGVIYRTNAMTSYAAGRYAQLVAGKFPLWVYRHGDSKEPRLEHLSWDGLVLPPEHPFWATHYPPSDWGCSCYVLGARSAAGARRLGGDPAKKLPPGWDRIDPKTGAPIGIGKNWNYAPGASVSNTVRAMAAKVGNWNYGIARTFMTGLPVEQQDALSDAYRALPSTADDLRRLAAAVFEGRRERTADKVVKSLAMVPAGQQARIEELVGKALRRSDFRYTSDFLLHELDEHTDAAIERSRGQRPVTAADMALLPRLLSDPDEIGDPGTSRSGETVVTYRKRFGAELWEAILVVNRRQDNLTLKSFYIAD